MTSVSTHTYFRTRRPIQIGGERVAAGEVIDLDDYDLPPGRANQLVTARLGSLVTVDDESVVRRRNTVPVSTGATDDQPPPGDEDGVTFLPLGEWTEVYLMGLGGPAQKDICAANGLPVRGTLSDRTDRLLQHQQETSSA